MDGQLFGLADNLKLPFFTCVEPYRSADGTVEIDAIGQGVEPWALEVKWKGKAAGRNELESFRKKAAPLASRLWYVAKAGFTQEAKTYASERGILISSSTEIEHLRKLL